MATRPAIFKWRQTEPVLILCAVRWYLRYSLSLRDVEELLEERGLETDHTTVWRWVQRYGPELEQRLRERCFIPISFLYARASAKAADILGGNRAWDQFPASIKPAVSRCQRAISHRRGNRRGAGLCSV